MERLLWSASAAVARYQADRCAQLAAAVSYNILLSLVPLFTFLGSVAGLLLQDSERRQNLIDYLIEHFPLSEDAGVDLERILTNLPTPASLIGIVSIAAVLWSASGMMASVRVGLTAALDDGGTGRSSSRSSSTSCSFSRLPSSCSSRSGSRSSSTPSSSGARRSPPS